MTFPKPEPGLVIRYAYLWLAEHRAGHEEGRKDRPCAIVLATAGPDGDEEVLVVPITHRAPADPDEALELPPVIKTHLGLDHAPSWVVLSESNLFHWPGPDLRPTGSKDGSVAYGFLPPRFFAELRRRFVALERRTRAKRIPRTE